MIKIQGFNSRGSKTVGKEVEAFTFPGGERQITLPKLDIVVRYIIIDAELPNSDAIMDLVLVKDAIFETYGDIRVDLRLGYIPYARQDRVANDGEALSARAFGNLINMLDFTNVMVVDPHSEVSVSYINNVAVIHQYNILNTNKELWDKIRKGDFMLVAPDSGSTSKVSDLSFYYYNNLFIQGKKIRDTKTGKLSGFSYEGDVKNRDLLIVDDICDGGGTFIGLTKELLDGGAKSVSLYVTHGIFSKGIDILINNGIKHIYTSDTIPQYEESEYLTVLKWR